MSKTKGARDIAPRNPRTIPPHLYRDKYAADPGGRGRIDLYISHDRLAIIEHMAEVEGIPVAAYVRRIIDRAIS